MERLCAQRKGLFRAHWMRYSLGHWQGSVALTVQSSFAAFHTQLQNQNNPM
jgi:hypothetical protein